MSIYNVLCVCVCVCFCVHVCVFVCVCSCPVPLHTKPLWRAWVTTTQTWHQEKMVGPGGGRCPSCWARSGLVWSGTGRERGEEVCRQCCAYDINKDIGHCAANSSNTNVDASFPCSCGCSFRCPGDLTWHRQICDGAQHHTKATEKWPTHLTAGVEELSTGKETVQDIPTSAPTVPSDLLQINIQRIVPQDTTIRVCVCVCVSNYVELPEVCCWLIPSHHLTFL